jgi:hypothetical protein
MVLKLVHSRIMQELANSPFQARKEYPDKVRFLCLTLSGLCTH